MAQAKIRYDAVIAAPFGRIGIVIRDGALIDLQFLPSSRAVVAPSTVLARRVCRQLQEYFRRPHMRFDIPLALGGTDFQRRVWAAMQRIPAGAPINYGTLARRLKTSARAVGNACRRNPVALVVPCHRVVAAAGDGGFMGKRGGWELKVKRWLLAHERGR